MKAIISTAISVYALCGTALAQQLPTAGSCEEVLGNRLINSVPSITWIGSDAIVRDHAKTFQGKIVGMRQHDAGFRFSVKYHDDILGLSEISVFRLPHSKPPKERLGVVHFVELTSGERVIQAMTGFVDAKCILHFQ